MGTCSARNLPLTLLLALAVSSPAGAQSTNPSDFVTISEVTPGGATLALTDPVGEVDDRSILRIVFDESQMEPPDPATNDPNVTIAVEAKLFKGPTPTNITRIDNYLSPDKDGNPDPHDKSFNPSTGASVVPDTSLDLPALGGSDYDVIVVKVTNLETQEDIERWLRIKPFGLRPRVTDSLFFIRRQGVDDEEQAAGVEDVNFGPAPGVSWGGVYFARTNRAVRFLKPGVGINLSFMDWSDPAFDIATGQFASGTTSNDIEIGMGIQGSLFNNIVQVTYGWNLHAEQDREYFGIGVSFVNFTSKVTGLIPSSQ